MMKTIVRKQIILETKRHDFDNEFAYIEQWSNSQLKDCYFAEKRSLFPDGSLKKGYKKFFFSPYSGEQIEKEIKPVNCAGFRWFDKLYFLGEDGEIYRIDGKPAAEVDYQIV